MNPAEVKRLMERIAAKQKPSYTQETRDDLSERGALGMAEEMWGEVEVVPIPADKASECVIVCTVLVMGELPTLPDNVIGRCEFGCGRIIQSRPFQNPKVPKACLYCVAERLESEQ